MKGLQILTYFAIALLWLVPPALGQDGAAPIEPIDPDMVNPAAHISYPPPVYVVRDSVDIRGTVTLDTMLNFFIEFRPLILDAMMDADDGENQWFPATLPRIEAVTDDVLGAWNTMTLPDGLYELRLTINTGGDSPEYHRVSPIRVENEPPPFAAGQQAVVAPEPAEPAEPAAPAQEPEPTDEPTPEPTDDPRPRVIANVNSNVRAGDSTLYAVIGHLLEGDSALVKGVSSYGTGWFYIELANGRSGFIYPQIVTPQGDLSNLPRINPPPLPPTPIPLPTAVPPPATGADLVINGVPVIDPHPATCKVGYSIKVTVRNAGNGAATNGGMIEVRDSRPDGSGLESTQIAFGPLAPGQTQEVNGYITPTQYYEETHHINFYLDIRNDVAETNENNNHSAVAPYILRRGSC